MVTSDGCLPHQIVTRGKIRTVAITN